MKFVGNFESESGAYFQKFTDLITSTVLSTFNSLETFALALQDSLNIASRSGYQLSSSSTYKNVTLLSDYVTALTSPFTEKLTSQTPSSLTPSNTRMLKSVSSTSSTTSRKRTLLKSTSYVRSTKIASEKKPLLLKTLNIATTPIKITEEAVRTTGKEEKG